MLSKEQALKKLAAGKLTFKPFNIEVYDKDSAGEEFSSDIVLKLSWENQENVFIGNYISSPIPQNLDRAITRLKRLSPAPEDAYPILLAPYLTDAALDQLADEKISGIDFSGNGIIVIPGEWFIMKTGKENQYPASRGIKNIYSGKSSLVPRVFIEQPGFESVSAIQKKIKELEAEISLSTVSKVLQALEDDFLVTRDDVIRLIEPEKLLTQLADNYQLPETNDVRFITVDDNLSPNPLSAMKENAEKQNLKLAGLTPERFELLTNLDDVGPIYTSSINKLLSGIECKESQRFPDFELRQTTDPRVYFASGPLEDSVPGAQEFPWCSPVECYLQYNEGDKRAKEAAEKMRAELLQTIEAKLA